MNTQQIVTDLEWLQKTIADAMNKQFRPKYKNNTWLKQKDLSSNERIIMQLVDEHDDRFTNKWLVDTTGLTRKCVRENLTRLMERGLVKRLGNTHYYQAISIV
jgi:predicted HTH transcriptional regulator